MSAGATQSSFVQPSHLVILGHPEPGSFASAVAQTYHDMITSLGHRAVLRDLYALGFDPRLAAAERPDQEAFAPSPEVAAELELLRHADVITLVYPIWFGMPPAIIKGYIDRVLGAGFSASAITAAKPHPLLAGKRLVLFTSSASTRPWLEEHGQWLALRQAFETYLRTIFSLTDGGHTHFDAIVPGCKPQYVAECLEVVREQARAVSAGVLSAKSADHLRGPRPAGAF